MPRPKPHTVHYNIYFRRFPSRRAAVRFARSIRGGSCIVHYVRPE
jgi:hypothetical protein